MVKAGGINDRGCQPNVHKTKHFIPAIAGTSHPAGVIIPVVLVTAVTEHAVKPMIRKQAKHCKARAETAVRPYTEKFVTSIKIKRRRIQQPDHVTSNAILNP